ncbi:hypothetical protein [Dokdonella sp.]|uniref:hypothetical protein n=1 Tax=Dokdonella sp. TaxID=2291710 RepID=UPI003784ED15
MNPIPAGVRAETDRQQAEQAALWAALTTTQRARRIVNADFANELLTAAERRSKMQALTD